MQCGCDGLTERWKKRQVILVARHHRADEAGNKISHC